MYDQLEAIGAAHLPVLVPKLPGALGVVGVIPPMEPVVLDVPPAPLVLRPCSRMHRSFSRPISKSQREGPFVDPADEDPIVLDPLPIVLLPPDTPPMLLPLPIVLPPMLLPGAPPTLVPVVPLVVPLEVCAVADIAKSAAAVAASKDLRIMLRSFVA